MNKDRYNRLHPILNIVGLPSRQSDTAKQSIVEGLPSFPAVNTKISRLNNLVNKLTPYTTQESLKSTLHNHDSREIQHDSVLNRIQRAVNDAIPGQDIEFKKPHPFCCEDVVISNEKADTIADDSQALDLMKTYNHTSQDDTRRGILNRLYIIKKNADQGGNLVNLNSHRQPLRLPNSMDSNKLSHTKRRLNKAISSINLTKIRQELVSDKALILSELEAAIINTIPTICIDNKIAVYTPPMWKYVDIYSFITIIRTNLPQYQEVFDGLLERQLKELFLKLQTNPIIQATRNTIERNKTMLNLRDAVYDIKNRCYLEQSPDYYFFDFINVSRNEIGAGNGYFFEHYMHGVTGGDLNLYQLILEMIAVVISPVMLKKFFLLLGSTDTGKSRLGLLLGHMLSEESVTSIADINTLAEKHASALLKEKKLCLCLDLARQTLDEKAIAILRQITGGDPLSINPKHKDYEKVINKAKFVIAANHLPPIRDPDMNVAFYKRMVIIPFRHQIPLEIQVDEIDKKMALEKGYILGKVFDVLSELHCNNYLLTEVNTDMDDDGAILSTTESDVETYINTNCEFTPSARTFSDDLYSSYTAWCRSKMIAPLSKISFCQRFAILYPTLEKKHSSRNGKTANYYNGIKLREVESND